MQLSYSSDSIVVDTIRLLYGTVSVQRMADDLEISRQTVYTIIKKHKLVKNYDSPLVIITDKIKRSRKIPVKSSTKSNLPNSPVVSKSKLRTQKIKTDKGCCICGFNEYPESLDFHHLDPESKSFPIASGMRKDPFETFDEISKCVVICSNHHRALHTGSIYLPDIEIDYWDVLDKYKQVVYNEYIQTQETVSQ